MRTSHATRVASSVAAPVSPEESVAVTVIRFKPGQSGMSAADQIAEPIHSPLCVSPATQMTVHPTAWTPKQSYAVPRILRASSQVLYVPELDGLVILTKGG